MEYCWNLRSIVKTGLLWHLTVVVWMKLKKVPKLKIWLSLVLICFFCLKPVPILAKNDGFGMFNVYFSIDEALGYQEIRDDLSEVHSAGCRLVTHYFRQEHSRNSEDEPFWFGLKDWLEANSEAAERLQAWKQNYGESLGWKLFFYSTYLQEAYQQTKGGLKVLVGEIYGMFPSDQDDADLKAFVTAILEFEAADCSDSIGGWYVIEEPNSSGKRYRPARYASIVALIQEVEVGMGISPHPVYIDISPYRKRSQVAPFLTGADVIMISPDAYIWARVPPTYVEEAQYESIHHAIRSMREHAKAADNPDAKIEVVLQAYDWNPKGPLQPSHINMHQQVNYALQPGWVDRGIYAIRPRWEPPPDGIWFWWWHDCKSKKRTPQGDIIEINRWDKGTKGGWAEAIQTELSKRRQPVQIRGTERWQETIHIIGDVIVNQGATLILEAGTIVKFAVWDHFQSGRDSKRCELIVRGKLVVEGTPDRKVLLTSDAENQRLSVRARKPRKGDWYGIWTDGPLATVMIRNCQIQHAIHK